MATIENGEVASRRAKVTELLTHSRMQCFRTCPKKHHFAYELKWRRDRDVQPLRMGAAVHVGIDALAQCKSVDEACGLSVRDYEALPDWANTDELLADWLTEREIVLRLVSGYAWRWGADTAEVLATEQSFSLPIVNPETGRSTPSFRFAGKIDKIVRVNGRVMIREHKTCGADIGPDADYWKRLRMDQQISGYMHAAIELGHAVESVEYDVIRKPSIRPRRLTKSEQQAVLNTGQWFGEPATVQERETPAMFGARFTSDIASRPDFYFARREIPRLDADLAEFRAELWAQQLAVQTMRHTGRWWRNSAACLAPYRCDYFELCADGHDEARGVPLGFVALTFAHPELESANDE